MRSGALGARAEGIRSDLGAGASTLGRRARSAARIESRVRRDSSRAENRAESDPSRRAGKSQAAHGSGNRPAYAGGAARAGLRRRANRQNDRARRGSRKMNLRQLFDVSLANRRDQIGLEWAGREYTFGEIDARSNRMAHALRSRGFEPGDRVCVQLANRIEMIDLFLACVKLGVIFVPVNILYRERETSHILADAEPKLFVTERELAELASSEEARDFPALDGDAPAALVYTSGTTGTSKGAVLTHNNFASNAANLVACWQVTERDRFLLALPLFHVHALGNGLHCWLISGCRMRLLERFDHQTVRDQFLDFRPTLFFGVPTVYV